MSELDNSGFIEAEKKRREEKSVFDHPFFRTAPALASLRTISEPKPEHVRACLMELVHHLITSKKKDQWTVVVSTCSVVTGVFGRFSSKEQAKDWVKAQNYSVAFTCCIVPFTEG